MSLPPCCTQQPGSACAAPTPRETNNYYSRNHNKEIPETCKGSCYCPDDCCCPHSGLNGRFVDPCCCDPCAVMDCCCPPQSCCCKKRCCSPCSPRCCIRPKVCPDPCRPPSPCCEPCCAPYCPPCRKPICYPPVKCCETECSGPCERICYYPCPQPCQPKYCTCGSPNPCDCDLSVKKRQALCDQAPCCRRCGRKVYAAEKIMASGGAFHSSCFSCYCCHKPLEVTNLYENQGEIYCKQCYAKFFGVQGYGYGQTLNSAL